MSVDLGRNDVAVPLFVVGLGRSGTTALVETLSAHPDVALGIERYKRWSPDFEFTRDLFTAGRFFDFSDELTNIVPALDDRWRLHYDQMATKWDTARYVGDKLTRVRPQRIWRTLPDARIVFAVRDINAVAHSWQVRADNPADTVWTAESDARASVEKWNEALHQIRRAARRRPDHVRIVEHRDFFGDAGARRLREVLAWLDLDPAPEILASFDEMHRRYLGEVAPKPRELAPDDLAFLRATADRKAWRRVLRLAREVA